MSNEYGLFLDSGAHSLWNFKQQRLGMSKSNPDRWAFYKSQEFKTYVDRYSCFVKEHKEDLDVFVNVDVIGNPEMTWKIQRYIETAHGIVPLPVVHFGTPMKWITHYIEQGYDYIGIGGLKGISRVRFVAWADQVFDVICDTPDRLPCIKVHGFAITALSAMMRYPFYSVDSTSWTAYGRYGAVLVPRRVGSVYVYDEKSWVVMVSQRSPSKSTIGGKHIETFPVSVREEILRYFTEKGYPLGESDFKTESETYELKEGERWVGKAVSGKREVEIIVVPGMANDYAMRDELNIIYFLDLQDFLPAWPWAWDSPIKGQVAFDL